MKCNIPGIIPLCPLMSRPTEEHNILKAPCLGEACALYGLENASCMIAAALEKYITNNEENLK